MKHVESLESNNIAKHPYNKDAFSDFIDRYNQSKNIIIYNVREPADNAVNNSGFMIVNRIIEKLGVNIKPISIIHLSILKNNTRS